MTIILLLGACLLAAEVGARLLNRFRPSGAIPLGPDLTGDYFTPFVMRGRCPSFFITGDDQVRFSHGEIVPITKPTTEYRVVILGGSVASGESSGLADAWFKRLEERLSTETGRRVRVICAANGAHLLVQEMIYLVLDVLRVSPDLVIFYHGANEIGLPYFFGTRVGIPFDYRLKRRMLDSLTWHALVATARRSVLAAVLLNRLIAKEIVDGRRREWDGGRGLRRVTALYSHLLAACLDLLRTRQIAAAVAIHPILASKRWRTPREQSCYALQADLGSELGQGLPRIREAARRVADEHGARFLDMDEHFSTIREEVFSDYAHYTRAGESMIVEYFVRHLREVIDGH